MRTLVCVLTLLGAFPLVAQSSDHTPIVSAPVYQNVASGSACNSCGAGNGAGCLQASLDQVPGRCGLDSPNCAIGLWANYCNEKKPCWQPGQRVHGPVGCRAGGCSCGGLFGSCGHCRTKHNGCSTGGCAIGANAISGDPALTYTDTSTAQPTPADAPTPPSDVQAPALPTERDATQPIPPPADAAPASELNSDDVPVPPAPRTSRRTAKRPTSSGSNWPFGPAR